MYVGLLLSFIIFRNNTTINPSFTDPFLFFKNSTNYALMWRNEFCLPVFCFDNDTVTCCFNMTTVIYAATQNPMH